MGINVLSLFDGISCGQLALQKLGMQVDNYIASEIDTSAIKVTQKNFPNTLQIGDVSKINTSNLPKIDLLIGGSPCQGFSSAGKGLNFNDPRSKLFFEFVRILKEVQPTYFLLENVVMKKEYESIITEYLGVSPILIDSQLVSAQTRKRLYWTNIPNIKVPDDRNISFSQLTDGKYCGSMRGRRINAAGKRQDNNYNLPIIQYIESNERDKSNCLTTVDKDNVVIEERYKRVPAKLTTYRWLTCTEYEQLQTIPVDYTKVTGVSDSQRKKLIGNAWTVDIISHILGEAYGE